MDIDSLRDQFCDYSTHMRGYSPDTIRRYRITIQVFRRALAIDQIEQCTAEGVRTFFYRGRAERHWAASTFVTYHNSLVVFFRWCVQHGHLRSNPTDGLELPRIGRALPRKLTEQETTRFLEVIHNYPYPDPFLRERNVAIFATFVYAGLRRKELLRLQMVDLDVRNQSIFVRRGKGNKDRIVPIKAQLAGILGRYLSERGAKRKTCPEVFTSHTRDAGMTNEGLKRLVAFARRVTGLPIGVHRLRHTFATLMLEGGCNIFALSTMMGHSDIKTTTIYLTATAEHLRNQMAKHPLTYV